MGGGVPNLPTSTAPHPVRQIGRAKLVGVLCSASLLGLVVLDMPEFPLAHLFLTDVFWMSGMVYQCFLTYIQVCSRSCHLYF